MKRDVHDRLTPRFESHSVERRLHDVPPHEVYEVRVDGRRAVYKGTTGPTGRAGVEGRVLAFVGARTSVPVPTVLAVGADYFVAAWHPDAPAPDEPRDADGSWARAAGRCLATLHDETAPLIDVYGQFRVDEDDTGTASLGRELDVGVGPGSDPPGGETTLGIAGSTDWHPVALEYLSRYRSVLAAHGHADVVDRVVDALTDRPGAFEGAGEPVCCHGWATPEHVGVVDGRVGCVLDFEHAIAAPAEFDYWRTVVPTFDHGRSGDVDPGSPLAAFREGYESVRPLPAGLAERKPLYTLLNGVYYLVSLYVQAQHGPDATADRARYLRDRLTGTLDRLP